MARRVFSTLIRTSALRSLLDAKAPVTVVDASYAIPGTTGNPKEEHFNRRIPGARFFEIDEIADKSVDLPHMVPSEELFASYMKRLRIKNDENLIVCYDRLGMISSPRVWYTFKLFGKKNVAVLDGGLPKWLEEGHPVEAGKYDIYQDERTEKNEEYRYRLDRSRIKDLKDVKKISESLVKSDKDKGFQILDARSAGRFNGKDPEPRPGLRSGSIPGSINMFFKDLYNPDKTMKDPKELRAVFEKAGVSFDSSVNVVNSCGSGITACINILGLEVAGRMNNSLYDGSWAEWGAAVKP